MLKFRYRVYKSWRAIAKFEIFIVFWSFIGAVSVCQFAGRGWCFPHCLSRALPLDILLQTTSQKWERFCGDCITDTHTDTDLCWRAPQCQCKVTGSALSCRQPPGHAEFKDLSACLSLFHRLPFLAYISTSLCLWSKKQMRLKSLGVILL